MQKESPLPRRLRSGKSPVSKTMRRACLGSGATNCLQDTSRYHCVEAAGPIRMERGSVTWGVHLRHCLHMLREPDCKCQSKSLTGGSNPGAVLKQRCMLLANTAQAKQRLKESRWLRAWWERDSVSCPGNDLDATRCHTKETHNSIVVFPPAQLTLFNS